MASDISRDAAELNPEELKAVHVLRRLTACTTLRHVLTAYYRNELKDPEIKKAAGKYNKLTPQEIDAIIFLRHISKSATLKEALLSYASGALEDAASLNQLKQRLSEPKGDEFNDVHPPQRQIEDPTLKELLARYEKGEFDIPGVRARLRQAFTASDESETTTLRRLRQTTEDRTLKDLLARYEKGEFDDPGVRARLRQAFTASDEGETTTLRRLRQTTEDRTLKELLARYEKGEFEIPGARARLKQAFAAPDESEVAALQQLHQVTQDRVLKELLSRYEKGEFDVPSTRARLKQAFAAAEESETTALRHLRKVTQDRTLKELLLRYEKGEFDALGLRSFLRLLTAEASTETAAAKFLATVVQERPLKEILKRFADRSLNFPALASALDFATSADAEKAAIKLLSRTTSRNWLSKLLQQMGKEEFDSAEVEKTLDLAISSKNLLKFCINHTMHNASDKTVALILRKYIDGKLGDDERFRLIRQLMEAKNYVGDLFGTLANATWLEGDSFKRAYEAGASVAGWASYAGREGQRDVRWRMYTLICCARAAQQLRGHFVECGVDKGGSAMCVISALPRAAFAERKFYLFDTFAGLVAEQLDPEEKALSKIGELGFGESYDDVVRTFAPFGFTEIVRGAVPDTLSRYDGSAVAYLHIDMNVAFPERAAFEYFWPLLADGAPVVFDDYGFPRHKRQKLALDEAARELGVEIMMLPTGQGLVWKLPEVQRHTRVGAAGGS